MSVNFTQKQVEERALELGLGIDNDEDLYLALQSLYEEVLWEEDPIRMQVLSDGIV